MREIRKQLATECQGALRRLHPELLNSVDVEELIEEPKDRSHGDLALPCFAFAKALRQAPPVIASALAKSITEQMSSAPTDSSSTSPFSTVQAIGPYVNFRISTSHLASMLAEHHQSGTLFSPRASLGEKVMIEYSQPNTHKAFHVGHVRCAALGDTVARLCRWIGFEVHPVNYLGDEGTHVAKCLWYFKNRFQGEIPEHNRGEFLGTLYSAANAELDLARYTECPVRGVQAVRLEEVTPHPSEKDWSVLRLATAHGEVQVVSAASAPALGTLLAYAKPGLRLGGRAPIAVVDKKGVESIGMVCTATELGMSGDKETLLVLPPGTSIGCEVADIYAKADFHSPSVIGYLDKLEGEVSQVLQKLESADPEMKKLWEETKQWSMEDYYEVYAWLHCEFEKYFFESEFGESGKALVREYHARGVFTESDGTIGADLKDEGLGFCILIKSDGTATYACRDLVLARKKFEEFHIDRSYYVVDVRQKLHFQQVFRCLERMGYEQAAQCEHIAYEMVTGSDGQMGSRKGNVILFTELRNQLYERLETEFIGKYRGDWPDEEIEQALHALSLATMRYGMLQQENNSLIVFDLQEWTSRSGNTGPYLMYAYARTQSILRELGDSETTNSADFSLLNNPAEHDLLLRVALFEDTVTRAARQFAPNMLCSYLFDLSKAFNRFYAACPVKGAESAELQAARCTLVRLTGAALKQGFSLLGVPVIERM